MGPDLHALSEQHLLLLLLGIEYWAEWRIIVLTQWDISCILKSVFPSFPACPLVVKDGNNFAGTVCLCSSLFLIYGIVFIT